MGWTLLGWEVFWGWMPFEAGAGRASGWTPVARGGVGEQGVLGAGGVRCAGGEGGPRPGVGGARRGAARPRGDTCCSAPRQGRAGRAGRGGGPQPSPPPPPGGGRREPEPEPGAGSPRSERSAWPSVALPCPALPGPARPEPPAGDAAGGRSRPLVSPAGGRDPGHPAPLPWPLPSSPTTLGRPSQAGVWDFFSFF